MTTTVTYNRTLKQYQLIDQSSGEIIQTWESGAENGEAARREALGMNDPHAHGAAQHLTSTIFQNRPDLHGRIWRAAEIIAEGGVGEAHHIIDEPNTIARVQSQNPNRPRRYAVAVLIDPDDNRKLYYCQCYDFTGDSDHPAQAPEHKGHKYCKHIFAVKMMLLLRRPFTPDEPGSAATPRQIINHQRNRTIYAEQYGIDPQKEDPIPFQLQHALDVAAFNSERQTHNRAMKAHQQEHDRKRASWQTADTEAGN